MSRKIELNGERLRNKREMAKYMKELFPFGEEEGNNLDVLKQCLKGINEDTDFILTHENIRTICSSSYAYRFLMVLDKAMMENRHLSVHFKY